MPRANRHALTGHVWHITHRCHRQQFLLKFARDRRLWRQWLFEARKRYGLCVLDFIVTSNHIHLLVQDRGRGEIANSMQLIAGRSAQAYNQRKQRRGAYWEDRYHATAVQVDTYLARCIAYIDLNMVRAGAVSHPREWEMCGYQEIQHPPARYRVIDYPALMNLLGISSFQQLQLTHRHWVEDALKAEPAKRDERWSQSLAIGSYEFISQFQADLGATAIHRDIEEHGNSHALREDTGSYTRGLDGESSRLRAENVAFLDDSV
ncbi:MAG: transposase [Gammaproteobacteria bacterium]